MPLEGETRQILDIVHGVEKMFNEGGLKRVDIPKDVFIQMSDYAKGKAMEKAVEITQTTDISFNKTVITTLKSDYENSDKLNLSRLFEGTSSDHNSSKSK